MGSGLKIYICQEWGLRTRETDGAGTNGKGLGEEGREGWREREDGREWGLGHEFRLV